MDLSFGYIFTSLIVSGIGWVYFSYGRKQKTPVPLVIGLVLMVFPYFVQGVIAQLLIAAVLMAVPYLVGKYT